MIEYYLYHPVLKRKSSFSPFGANSGNIENIKQNLSDQIKDDLIQKKPFNASNWIGVETRKQEIIEKLDEIMQVKKDRFARLKHIEIPENEISMYEYFYIDQRVAKWGDQIKYEENQPNCKEQECPWGAKVISFFKINMDKTHELQFARISGLWEDLVVRLLISKELKDVFDKESITGLKYTPCTIDRNQNQDNVNDQQCLQYFVAEIESLCSEEATKIYPHSFCQEHKILFRLDGIVGRHIISEKITGSDFQVIDRIQIGKDEYYFRHPDFFISQRVLKILLKYAEKDLRKRGLYLNKKYVPVVFD